MNDELKAKAEALGIKVDARWSDATLQEKIAEVEAPAEQATERYFPVRLLKNYRPANDKRYRIVGDRVPPPFHGVGKENKLWAGTVVELPFDEAKALMENTVIESEAQRDADGNALVDGRGKPVTRKVTRPYPLAVRADEYTITA